MRLLAATVVALLLLAAAYASPAEPSASASYTLLGLGSDLYGVHYDPSGWMILVGRGGSWPTRRSRAERGGTG